MMIHALIFDFDGLIFDTETPDYETWSGLYREHGFELAHERWITGVGTHGGFDAGVELAELLDGRAGAAALRSTFSERYRARCHSAPLLPGVADLLAAARATGLPAAVASSSNRAWVEGWLAHHGLREHFVCVRTRDDVARVKPAPDLFLSAAACLGVPADQCLVFEDSPNGMRAAAAAGIRCVAVPIAINADVELPPVALRMRSLAELPLAEIIARVEAA
ncbi:MAG: HAD-IA family hydrolase [Roseiflexaceae bacterium]|nr:HAD-IA family hydrolase [Roseiflexaceae bacterium]